jgi:hypothetical protein
MKNLTLTRSTAPRKTARLVIYNIEGRTGSVQFLSTLFGGDQKTQGNPPATLTLTGEGFAEPRQKETKEERKARLALLPKPTLQQKAASLRERLAKMEAKLNAPATVVPVEPTPAAPTTPAAAPAPKTSKKKR